MCQNFHSAARSLASSLMSSPKESTPDVGTVPWGQNRDPTTYIDALATDKPEQLSFVKFYRSLDEVSNFMQAPIWSRSTDWRYTGRTRNDPSLWARRQSETILHFSRRRRYLCRPERVQNFDGRKILGRWCDKRLTHCQSFEWSCWIVSSRRPLDEAIPYRDMDTKKELSTMAAYTKSISWQSAGCWGFVISKLQHDSLACCLGRKVRHEWRSQNGWRLVCRRHYQRAWSIWIYRQWVVFQLWGKHQHIKISSQWCWCQL